MSFSRPKRSVYGAVRHSRSSSTLSGLREARRSRNCFQRRPLRATHSTQCLFPSANDAEEDAEGNVGPASLCATLTAATDAKIDDLSGSDSEYSEYDLVNEQMQDFLLDSDDLVHDEDDADGVLSMGAYCTSGFLPLLPVEAPHGRLRRRTASPQRRRLAKKAESSASLSTLPRMTPSTSTTLLSDLDTNLREVASWAGHAHLRHRKQPHRSGTSSGDRRWLLPALAIPRDDTASAPQRRWPLFTVVFDLDETLIGARCGAVQLRPHVGDLLRTLHGLPVEIVVWTAGTAHYVNPILHAIGQACGRREWFHHIISRHRRWYTGANTSVKDLSQLGRPLDRVVMIENNPISVVQQPHLCILVEDYLQANAADESLLVLLGVLERVVETYRSTAAAAAATAVVAVASSGETANPAYSLQGPQRLLHAEHGGDPLSTTQSCGVPPLSVLLNGDPALQTVEFRTEDVCKEDGVSMNQRVELRERVGGADTLLCRGLRYTPSSVRGSQPSSQTPVSVAVRSYGCVNPLIPL